MIEASLNFTDISPSPGQGYITGLKQGVSSTVKLTLIPWSPPQALFIGTSTSLSLNAKGFASGLSLRKIHNPNSSDRTIQLSGISLDQGLLNIFGHEVSLHLEDLLLLSDKGIISGEEAIISIEGFTFYSSDSYLYKTTGGVSLSLDVLHTSGEDINILRGILSSIELDDIVVFSLSNILGNEASINLRPPRANTLVNRERVQVINNKNFLVLVTPSWQDRREEIYEFEQERTEDLKFFINLLPPEINQ